jgi:hypothetical protein
VNGYELGGVSVGLLIGVFFLGRRIVRLVRTIVGRRQDARFTSYLRERESDS